MPQVGSRKRPAPGSSPEQSPAQNDPKSFLSPMASDHFPQWNPANSASTQSSYPAPSATFVQPQFTGTPQQQLTSNKLARRPLGQDIADRTPYSNDSNTDLWPSFAADNGIQQPGDADRANNVDELDQRALVAELDAQTKRKQIPPFVQKLGRYARFPVDGSTSN